MEVSAHAQGLTCSVGVRLLAYGGLIVTLSTLLGVWLASEIQWNNLPAWTLLPVGCVLTLAASSPIVTLVNHFAAIWVRPRRLPRVDKNIALSESRRTLVVVPALIESNADIDRLVTDLEVRFKGNSDPGVRYALLTDFSDAAFRELPQDEAMRNYVIDAVRRLNTLHSDRFLLLHRDREWNPYEGVWMGRERKRGKLADLNAFLRRGCRNQTFSTVVGPVEELPLIEYVITLDEDTQLLPGVVSHLVATMESPRNQPQYESEKRRVVGGYGILQPRPVQLPSEVAPTRYQLVWCDELSPASHGHLKSDVYQDVFGEGSYYGKGIYSVEALDRTLAGRIPDNQVLSHDLLEGCYARSGGVNDVAFPEEYPRNLHTDLKRRHRWTRGDWQLGPWLLPYVKNQAGVIERNPISLLGKWKIFDNIRRTLLPIALTISFFLGWFLSPTPARWTALVIGLIFSPALLMSISSIGPFGRDDRPNGLPNFHPAAKLVLRASLEFIFQCHTSLVLLNATFLALWRMLVTRRRLLQWLPSVSSTTPDASGLLESVRCMKVSLCVVVVTAAVLWHFEIHAFSSAAPVLCIWGFAPVSAWWLGRPIRSVKNPSSLL